MASKDNILVDLIGDVVDSMRATGTIDSFTELNGVYTVISDNELKSKEVIRIEDIDYVVTVIDSNSFSIKSSAVLDLNGKTWKALSPYYEHGHIKEIANTLNDKNKGIYTYQKYPLIILFQDYEVQKSVDSGAVFGTTSARLAITNMTKPELKSSERYDYNFRDILFPLYDQFIDALVNIGYFGTSPNLPYITHTEIERPYWGSDLANNNQNILNDWIDAIELQNTELKILNGIQNC